MPVPPLGHVAGTLVPLELVPVLVAAVLYAKRVTTLADRGQPQPVWRQACFGGGLLLVCVALFSPVGHVSEELVLMHMVEHLLIGDIAALLLVLGLTGPLLQPLLAIPVLGRLRVLANPAVAFPLWAIDLLAWHIPALYDAAYGGAAVHAPEHTMFIFCGCLMWMALLGPLPKQTWRQTGTGLPRSARVAARFA